MVILYWALVAMNELVTPSTDVVVLQEGCMPEYTKQAELLTQLASWQAPRPPGQPPLNVGDTQHDGQPWMRVIWTPHTAGLNANPETILTVGDAQLSE